MWKDPHLRESSPPRKRIRVRKNRVREDINGSWLVVKGLGLDNNDYIKNHDISPNFNSNYTFRNYNSNVSNVARDGDRGIGKEGGSTGLVDINNYDVNHHKYLNCNLSNSFSNCNSNSFSNYFANNLHSYYNNNNSKVLD